jgi:hypothetical protein
MLPYVTIKKLADESGYSVDAIEAKIKRGEFAEGIHFVKAPDGRIHFNTKAYIEWVESSHTVKVSNSRSGGTANVTALHSRSKPRPAT